MLSAAKHLAAVVLFRHSKARCFAALSMTASRNLAKNKKLRPCNAENLLRKKIARLQHREQSHEWHEALEEQAWLCAGMRKGLLDFVPERLVELESLFRLHGFMH
ncbi:MAG: hypothetical protein ACRD4Q_09830, partial [Candidatus Acidiferrales bacterium]